MSKLARQRTNRLWIITMAVWAVAALVWPALAAAQAATGVKEPGLLGAGPWTLMSTGLTVFAVGVPLACALTVFVSLIRKVTGLRTAKTATLGWAGFVALLVATVLVAVFATQVVGFFIVAPALTTMFGLS